MSLRIHHLSLGIGFDHPLVDLWMLASGIEYFIYGIPSHSVNLNRKLMDHLFILVLGLGLYNRQHATDIIPTNKLIARADH
jgi:hypothetical protein